MMKFIKILFTKISLSLFFISNINLLFASVKPEITVQGSDIGSGVAMVPAQVGTIILILFFLAIYFHKKIKQTKLD